MPPATVTPSDFDARTLLDCVDDVIIVVDDDFRFTYANTAARDFLGTSLVATADQAGTEPLDVVHPEDVQHVAERFAEIVADDNGRGTLRLRVREGDGWRPVEALLTNRRDVPGINGVVVCFRNLTQEERLRSNLEIHSNSTSTPGAALRDPGTSTVPLPAGADPELDPGAPHSTMCSSRSSKAPPDSSATPS